MTVPKFIFVQSSASDALDDHELGVDADVTEVLAQCIQSNTLDELTLAMLQNHEEQLESSQKEQKKIRTSASSGDLTHDISAKSHLSGAQKKQAKRHSISKLMGF